MKEKRGWRSKTQASPPAAPPVAAVAPPPPPTPEFTPYEPPAPYAAPEAASAATPAPGAVAVLERDPLEFPGQPLPDNFFAALPERAKRAPLKVSRKLVVLGVIGVSAGVSAIGGWADRNDDISSPARHLVAGACAEYRDINDRVTRDPSDLMAGQEALAWFRNNGDRFAAAARLDPELQPAANYVVWFNEVLDEAVPGAVDLTDAELADREQALTDACYIGPGRA